MKTVIVDTSVIIKWFFPESSQDKALVLKKQHLDGEIFLCTRDLALYEFTSVFNNYSTQRIEEKDFQLACSALEALKMKYFSLEFNELSLTYTLAKKLTLSVYDCSFVLLAQKLNSTLYTSDKKLYQKAKTSADVVLV
ncbi:hypothetical protein CO083_01110 [Candidatus Roizmanbacteria bacterium CG_4_9_14_0_8_um_filter_34_12]|uniref:PIN domain-containing protein n=3 Tax=Candidatus Roizmaniibacteriota TaxID=1752723 RepID=A0A2H0C3H4_9BACT|nr:MAG: hypothetical protein COW96_02280 [Candidatus Roizmanbacteria bacterium CG22_combo_CG10-13_8_21_14_all_33_16]PIX71115.1 MAG: hypothetical protein COZ39_03955 [Candidatus Roizmanbacteria bacterium CG_4_10_14_3_um_filter_33_21]PJB89169.1 MAG: hypothetical protein CO083_01110 [Candidatus Roizmanbacteria bacterium CG_4_9_14_0_8_um_filter_34_12]